MYRTAVDVGRLNRPNSYELRNLRRRLPEPRHRRPRLHGRLPESLEHATYETWGQGTSNLPPLESRPHHLLTTSGCRDRSAPERRSRERIRAAIACGPPSGPVGED